MKRILEFDGLRGFAALIVVIAHYFGEPEHRISRFLALGWLGVAIFFVLSGFLIGNIIRAGHKQPGFYFDFYAKRIARIQPIYYAVILFVLAASALTAGHAWSNHPFNPLVYFGFVTNFAMSFTDMHWHQLHQWWTGPFWTLAVEEQFYLLLPLVIAFVPSRQLMVTLGALWVIALLSRIVLVYSGFTEAADVLLIGRMDLLVAGVMLGVVWQHGWLRPYILSLRLLPIVCFILIVGVSAYGRATNVIWFDVFLSAGIFAWLLATLYGAPEGKFWLSPVWRFFGKISYCLYLVHQPVSGVLHGVILDARPDCGTLPQLAVTALAFVASIGVATLSWYVFEEPVIRAVNTWLTRRAARKTPAPATAGA